MKGSHDRERISPPQSIDTISVPTSTDDSQSQLIEKLLLYESCSRTADADFQASCAHLWPLFVTLQTIGRKCDEERLSAGRNASMKRKSARTGFFGFGSSREKSSSRSIGTASSAASSADTDDAPIKGRLSYKSIVYSYKILADTQEEFGPDKASTTATRQTLSNVELIKVDRQLMYMLQQLSSKFTNYEKSAPGSKSKKETISFPEFVCCYRLVVCGMQTLQHLSGNIASASGDFRISEEDIFRLKKRTADRIAGMISMFGPIEYQSHDAGSNILLRTPTRSSPSTSDTKNSIFPAKLFASSIVDTSDDEMETAGELEEEIEYLRRLLAVKDKQLLRALNDHVDNIESLSHETTKRDEAIRRYIRRKRRRRKRLRRMLAVFFICVMLVCYEAKVIRVVVVNRIPRLSLHFHEFAHVFGSVSDSEVRAIKHQSLEKEYQIQILERQIAALEAESKKTKESLKISRELALDSCRAEMRKAREEAAILRRERTNEHNQQQPSYMKYFQKYLLGPFYPTDEI